MEPRSLLSFWYESAWDKRGQGADLTSGGVNQERIHCRLQGRGSRARPCRLSRGDKKQGRCFSVHQLDEHGVVVKRCPGEPCEGKEENIQDFPFISCNHLLHHRCQTRKSLQEGAVVWAGKGFRCRHITLRHIRPRWWFAWIGHALPGSGSQPRVFNCSGVAAVRITRHVHRMDIEPGVETKSPQRQSLLTHSSLALQPDSFRSSGDKRLKPCGCLIHRNRIRT